MVIHGERGRSTPIDITGMRTAALLWSDRGLIHESAYHRLMFMHMDRLHADIPQFVRESRVRRPWM